MDFVWSKLNTDQIFVQFSLENLSNDPFYSSAIDIHTIDENKNVLVQFDNSPHVFFLQIQYDQHHIRRHIHLIGKFIVKNLTAMNLDLKFYLNVGTRSIDLFIDKNHSYVSCLQTIDDIQSIQWNSSNKHAMEQIHADGILSTSEQTTIWIHLFQLDNIACLVFTPIVIYRSFLTQSVELHLNRTHSCRLQSNGVYTYFHGIQFNDKQQKYQHQLQQIDANQLTDNVFELDRQSYRTVNCNPTMEKPSQSLINYLLNVDVLSCSSSSNIIDLLRDEQRQHLSTDDDLPDPLIEQTNDILNSSFIPSMSANGPAMYQPSMPTTRPTALHQRMC
jgi:hypothetical protein